MAGDLTMQMRAGKFAAPVAEVALWPVQRVLLDPAFHRPVFLRRCLLENFPALVHALFDLLVENFAAHEKADVDGTACRAVERWPHRPEFDVFRRTDHHDRKSTRLNSSH